MMEEEITLDLKDFFYIIKKRSKLIIGITLMCTIVAGLLSFFVIKPTYEVSTDIIIGKLESEDGKLQSNNDVMMYQNLIKTYAVIAESQRVSEKASNKLNGKYTIAQLKDMMTVTPKQGTQILVIKNQGKDPQQTAKVAKAIVQSFVEEAKDVYPTGGNISVIDEPKVPKKPVKPKKALNMAIAFIIGLMGSIGLTFLIEYMDNTIKTENDVEKYLDLPVVGIIPKLDN
ncbi:Capsular polysaccharide biosynthesis protein [Clostridium cochlearium]|uniref:Capsular polysaccharide biosynthesis protein n=1 Tax=Clostridium cochlearium TaxID=1494 RepID=A0ABY0QMQ2_CLOCO|nr:Capsular polysaccharide biosynthesis protein [Clostridium cochlearium]